MIQAVSNGCPATKAACLCELPPGHDGPHKCACKGSWEDDGTVVAFPLGETTPLAALASFLGFMSDYEDEEDDK